MQDVNLILGKRVGGVGLFFSLTLTDNAAVGEKKKSCKTIESMLFCKVGKLAKIE